MARKYRKKGGGSLQHERVSEDINFVKLVFLQMDRILKAITDHNPNCIIGVDALETVLTHHHDDTFFKDLETIQREYKIEVRKNEVMGKIAPDTLLKIDFIKAKKKFRAIVRLMDRVGLFPEKEAEWVET